MPTTRAVNQKQTKAKAKVRAKSTGGVTPRQRVFVDRYVETGNGTEAAKAVGVDPKHAGSMASQWLSPDHFPLVAEHAQQRLAEAERKSNLTAEYVRAYIFEALNVNLLDWFEPGQNGTWIITKERLKELPHDVACLIESVEQVEIVTEQATIQKLQVRVVSKTAAMGVAAKYTLVQKHKVQATGPMVDLMALAMRAAEKKAAKQIEARVIEPIERS